MGYLRGEPLTPRNIWPVRIAGFLLECRAGKSMSDLVDTASTLFRGLYLPLHSLQVARQLARCAFGSDGNMKKRNRRTLAASYMR